MPAPDHAVLVSVDGKILYTHYDARTQRHSIECDLCGFVLGADRSGHASRLFEHRGTLRCIQRRGLVLGCADEYDPALIARLTTTVAAQEPPHIANRCPGAPYTWDDASVWDAYSFHKHKKGNLGWIPSGFEGDTVYIRADDCKKRPEENGHPCTKCQIAVNSQPFREIIGQAQMDLGPTTPAEVRSYAQLLASFRKSAEEKRTLRNQVRNLQRSLRAARQKLKEHDRLIFALSQRDVPRLRWLLTSQLKRGKNPKRLLSLVLRAADGIYRARGSDQRDRDVAFIVAALGGDQLLYALVHSHGLLSMSSVKKHNHYAQLLACAGIPDEKEINYNMSAFLDVAAWPLPSAAVGGGCSDPSCLPGHTIMVDDVALEERAQYNQKTNQVVGLSRESVAACNVSTEASSAEHVDRLAGLLKDGSLRLAKQATTVVIAPVAEPEHYSPVPLALAGSDKSEKGPALRDWLLEVLRCYNRHPYGAQIRGPVWSLASDGDATFRWARHKICCTHCLPEDSPVRERLQGLVGLNLHTSEDGKTTATCDPKHIIKRFATLLRSQTGVAIGDSSVIPEDVLESLEDVGGHPRNFAVQLLDPADKQNVPKATRLMSELHALKKRSIPPALAASPARMQRLRRVIILSTVLNFFTQPFIDVDMSLTQQLESLSAYAHSTAALFLHHRFKALTSALYADSQATVKNIFFTVARLQLLKKKMCLYLLHEGTDRLENVFADLRTLNHARNFDLLEAARKLSTAFHINSIFRRNPDLDRGHRRLDFSKVVGIDHINPASWKGDVVVDGIDLQQVWDSGRKRAVDLLLPVLGAVDFASCTCEGRDFLRPDGDWVGVSKHQSVAELPDDMRSERLEDSITPYIAPATERLTTALPDEIDPDDASIARELDAAVLDSCDDSHDRCSDWNLDNLFDKDAGPMDTVPVQNGAAPLDTTTVSRALAQDPRVFHVNGEVFWKASYIKAALSPSGGKKVTLRPLRARGVSAEDLFRKSRFTPFDETDTSDTDSVKRGDLVVAIFRTAERYNLGIVETSGFRAADGSVRLSMTADDFVKHCNTEKATVIGQVLDLCAESDSTWHWTRRYVPLSPGTKARGAAQASRGRYTVEIPAAMVHTFKPRSGVLEASQNGNASESTSEVTWTFTRSELQKLCDEAWQALEPDSEDIFANAGRLPKAQCSAQFPYHSDAGKPSFVIQNLPPVLLPVSKVQDTAGTQIEPVEQQPEAETDVSSASEAAQVVPGTQRAAATPTVPLSLQDTSAPRAPRQREQATFECMLCPQLMPLPYMRNHVGQHLMRAARSTADPQLSKVRQSDIQPDACGWCGISGTCVTSIEFRDKGRSPVIRSTCRYHYGNMIYSSAAKSSKNQPSTNVPIHCPLCPILSSSTPRTIWKYAAADHFNKEHAATRGRNDPALSSIFFFNSRVSREEESRLKIDARQTTNHRTTNKIPDSDDLVLPETLPHSAQVTALKSANSPLPTAVPSIPRKPPPIPALSVVTEACGSQRPLSPSSQLDLLDETPVIVRAVSRRRAETTESEKASVEKPMEKRARQ